RIHHRHAAADRRRMEHGQVRRVMAADAASTLAGRTALVPGGGRGVGREIALELARAGADVAVNYYVEPERAEATAADLAALGVRATAVAGDVGNAADVRGMRDARGARFGRLDILVNNAGTQTWTPFLE